MILSTFSYFRWPFVCLLWKNVFSGSLPSFQSGLFFFSFFAIELYKFLIYFGYGYLIGFIVCKDFLPFFFILLLPLVCRNFLVWCSSTCLFLLLLPVLSVSYPKKPLPISMSRSFFPKFSSRSFVFSGFMCKFLIYFELILCMV